MRGIVDWTWEIVNSECTNEPHSTFARGHLLLPRQSPKYANAANNSFAFVDYYIDFGR